MKNIIATVALVAFSLTISAPAFAQDGDKKTTTTTTTTKKNKKTTTCTTTNSGGSCCQKKKVETKAIETGK